MIVAELIAELQKYPSEMLVKLPYYDMGYHGNPSLELENVWTKPESYEDIKGDLLIIYPSLESNPTPGG